MQHRSNPLTLTLGLSFAVTACGGVTTETFKTENDVPATNVSVVSIRSEMPTRVLVVEGTDKISYELAGDIVTDSDIALGWVQDGIETNIDVRGDEVKIEAWYAPGILGKFLGELVVRVPSDVDLDVNQTLGNLTMEHPGRNVNAQVANGDVYVMTDLLRGTTTQLDVKLGNIFLQVPENLSADVDLRANQRIELNHPGLAQRQEAMEYFPVVHEGLSVGYQVSFGGRQAALDAQTVGGLCSRSVGAVFVDQLQ